MPNRATNSKAWPPRLANARHTPPPSKRGPGQPGSLLTFVTLAAIFLHAPSFAAQQQEQKQPAGYAGSETCATCHEDIAKAFQKNPHHIVETLQSRGWQTRACESCHGPGAKHAETVSPEDIFNPAKARPEKADQDCLKCHFNTPTLMGRVRSGHAKNQVACVNCHSVHKGPEELRPRRAVHINESCSQCHLSVWARFQRPYKHPLPQGAMSCVNCHDPHGSILPAQIRTVAANEPACFNCHGNLRGPFTHEHPPVRLEGCFTCHEPHGSTNPRMLIRREQRFLCLECHSNIGAAKTLGGVPPAFHDLRSARFQNCTICHQKIHGSYVDPNLER